MDEVTVDYSVEFQIRFIPQAEKLPPVTYRKIQIYLHKLAENWLLQLSISMNSRHMNYLNSSESPFPQFGTQFEFDRLHHMLHYMLHLMISILNTVHPNTVWFFTISHIYIAYDGSIVIVQQTNQNFRRKYPFLGSLN